MSDDLAHDTSGPASPKPKKIAPLASEPTRLVRRGKLRVFISYSRDDLDFADQLNAALEYLAASNVSSIAKASPVARTGNDASAT